MKKIAVLLVLAALLAWGAAATGVLIEASNPAAGLNDAAYYRYHDGDAAGAERLFLAAIAEDPSYELARYNLATLYFGESRYGEAATQLEALVALDNENPKYHFDLAVNLIEDIRRNGEGLERWGEAMDEYQTTLALDPGFPHAAENLAVLERIGAELFI